MTGLVRNIVQNKQFGFILGEDVKGEFFFHKSECKALFEDLRPGDRVKFEAKGTAKGMRAYDVEKA